MSRASVDKFELKFLRKKFIEIFYYPPKIIKSITKCNKIFLLNTRKCQNCKLWTSYRLSIRFNAFSMTIPLLTLILSSHTFGPKWLVRIIWLEHMTDIMLLELVRSETREMIYNQCSIFYHSNLATRSWLRGKSKL